MASFQRLRILVHAAAVGLCVVTSTTAQQTWKGRVFHDQTHGYKIQVPVGWIQLPLHITEKQILSWFETHKPLASNKKKGDTGEFRHATMRVLRLQKPWDGKGRNPGRRRDYVDYQRRRLSAQWKFTQTAGAHNSSPIVEWHGTLSGEGIDRGHILTWVYPRGEYDYAVQFYVLEEHFQKQRALITQTLRSFRILDPREEDPGASGAHRPAPNNG